MLASTCQIELFGATVEAETHGNKGQRRAKVFTSITNAQAEELGLSRITAWRSRRDGFFWLNYHMKEDNSTSNPLSDEEIDELMRCAKIGAKLALRVYNLRMDRLWPYSFEDLIQVAAEKLYSQSGHEDYAVEAWRIIAAKNRALCFIRDQVFNRIGSSAVFDTVVKTIASEDLDTDLEAVGERASLVLQIRSYVLNELGYEAWQIIWTWARSNDEITEEVKMLIQQIVTSS